MPARRMASAATRPPSLGRLKSFKAPPNLPKGLRTALMTTTSLWFTMGSPAYSTSWMLLNDGLLFQLADLLFRVTQQFGQDFGVVLAQQGSGLGERLRIAGQSGYGADQLDRAEDGVGHVNQQLPGGDVGTFKNLLSVLHRADS